MEDCMLSGPEWCGRFPGSASVDDLLPDFAGRVRAFLAALKAGGARVRIAATFRPPERAFLMHWAWQVAHAGQDPAAIPRRKTIPIAWLHRDAKGRADIVASRAAAAAMVRRYGIRYAPALTSRHTQRRAIDMAVGWTGILTLRDAAGQFRPIATGPRTGSNPALIEIGAGYGVRKLVRDPPHWSDDGH